MKQKLEGNETMLLPPSYEEFLKHFILNTHHYIKLNYASKYHRRYPIPKLKQRSKSNTKLNLKSVLKTKPNPILNL